MNKGRKYRATVSGCCLNVKMLWPQPYKPPITAVVFIALVLGPVLFSGSAAAVAAGQSRDAAASFSLECAGCHGADAHGTDHGPPLAGARDLRGRSISWIRRVIQSGIPSGGMPAFNLPAGELDALASLVHSLNSPASEALVAGDRAAGEEYFFGPGGCASCHMVDGRGQAIGPDLSNVARELTLGELRASLLQPSGRITPGYELVRVRLRNGKTVRGFARSESNFEIVVQDFQGDFHLLQQTEIQAVEEEKESLMPPVKASPDELQNLISYLSSLTGVKPGVMSPLAPPHRGGISWSRILHPRPSNWLTYNGNLNGNRYSELAQIDTRNVSQLRLKWIFTVPLWKQLLPDTPYFRENMKYFGLEVTPLVAGGIMYITGPREAYALDAATGQEIWEYRRPRSRALVGDASLGTNRGAAILGDKIFLTTDDAHLIALNRTTGKLMWEEVMPDSPMHYGSTVAPLVVKNMVIAGVAGADWGIRGFVA
ncbi:MAG: c-type cytochrome, partial [Terriglobia bacterium]